MTTLLAIVVGTFISEDLTCIAVGVAIQQGQLDWRLGLLGCYLGILGGDLGLWLLGRTLGAGVLRWRPVARRLPPHRYRRLAESLERHAGKVVMTARFLPGTRFVVYVAAGALGAGSARFLKWAALAGLVWTPLLVGLAALVGEPIVAPLERWLGHAGLALVAATAACFLLLRVIRLAGTGTGRARLLAGVSRVWRWEFWPAWLFYQPVLLWLGWLAVRYRGVTTFTAANPGIRHGGVVGESKYDILRRLPREWTVPTACIAPGPLPHRLDQFDTCVGIGCGLPVILKPDTGERGTAVRLIRDRETAAAYLDQVPGPVVMQRYHPGPFEAGVFYVRLPDASRGSIFSVTDKVFSTLVGDGVSTLEALIWRHPRYRMQARTFLSRFAGRIDDVPAAGETLALGLAGNHCQGTLFRDGRGLITPALEARFDAIAQGFDGFYFGRFDVRYTDVEAFRAGQSFAIIELNGVLSESTNIYDPAGGLVAAYRTLFRQWELAFRIGSVNRSRGFCPTPPLQLLRDVRHYYRHQKARGQAD